MPRFLGQRSFIGFKDHIDLRVKEKYNIRLKLMFSDSGKNIQYQTTRLKTHPSCKSLQIAIFRKQWRTWKRFLKKPSGRERGENLLMSAGGIYFLFQHIRGLDVLHYSRQRTRHYNNSKQGFILTAQLFINLVLSATAYRFHISIQPHSSRPFSFSYLIERLQAGELSSICPDLLNRDALTSLSSGGL